MRARAIDGCCDRVQVGVRKGHDRVSAAEAGDYALIRITQAIHLAAPVTDPDGVEDGGVAELDLRTEAGLFDVAGALVGVLCADL